MELMATKTLSWARKDNLFNQTLSSPLKCSHQKTSAESPDTQDDLQRPIWTLSCEPEIQTVSLGCSKPHSRKEKESHGRKIREKQRWLYIQKRKYASKV